MKSLFAAAFALSLTAPAFAEDAVGKWTGNVQTSSVALPINVVITKGDDGALKGVLQSPSQTPLDIPAENFVSDGKKLTFTSDMVQGSYSGVWDDAKKAWVGNFKQLGQDMPTELKRAQ